MRQVVGEQSVVLEWKPLGEEQPYPPRWMSARVHVDNPQISYTAEVTVPARPLCLQQHRVSASWTEVQLQQTRCSALFSPDCY